MQPQTIPNPPIDDSTAWLLPDEVREYVDGIPVNFNLYDKLSILLVKVINGWLTDLISSQTVTDLNTALRPATPPTTLTDNQTAWMKLIKPFLANAAWSIYILKGNVILTDTGPVVKQSDGFDPISDQQRSQLSNYYKAEADRYALKLSAMAISANGICGTSGGGSGRPSIRSSGGKRQSRFG